MCVKTLSFALILALAGCLALAFAEEGATPLIGKGRMRAKSFTAGRFFFSAINADVDISGANLSLDNISAAFCNGGVRGKGTFDLSKRPELFKFDMSLFDCDAALFKGMLRTTTSLMTGKLGGRMTVSGDFVNDDMIELVGEITMNSTKNEIFETAVANVRYNKNRVYLTNLKATEPSGGITTGEVDIAPTGPDSGFAIGKLKLSQVSVADIFKLLVARAPWLRGTITGNADLRYAWGQEKQQSLITGSIDSSDIRLFGLPFSGTGTFEYDGTRVNIRNISGISCGGTVTGSVVAEKGVVHLNANAAGFQLNDLMRALGTEGDLKGETEIAASLDLTGDGGLGGNVFASVKNGRLAAAPGIMSIVTFLGIPRSAPHEFNSGSAKLKLVGRRIIVEDASLISEKITLKNGRGYVDLTGYMHVQFDIYSETSVFSALFGKFGSTIWNLIDPVTKVVLVDVKGPFSDPKAAIVAFGKKVDVNEPIPEPEKDENKKPEEK
ncbi:MAG: hypothetical protein WC712_12335 [Candidatus Brocadiia bacterium]